MFLFSFLFYFSFFFHFLKNQTSRSGVRNNGRLRRWRSTFVSAGSTVPVTRSSEHLKHHPLSGCTSCRSYIPAACVSIREEARKHRRRPVRTRATLRNSRRDKPAIVGRRGSRGKLENKQRSPKEMVDVSQFEGCLKRYL